MGPPSNETMGRQPNRRRFLTAVGTSTFAFAGCTDAADDLPGSDEGAGSDDGNGDGLLDGGDDQQATPPGIDHGETVSDFEELDE